MSNRVRNALLVALVVCTACDGDDLEDRESFEIVDLASKLSGEVGPFPDAPIDAAIAGLDDADQALARYLASGPGWVKSVTWSDTRQQGDMYYRVQEADVPMYIVFCFKGKQWIRYYHPR